ncbi:MAG: Ubiquinone/menaquinone biosynthesis C-methyltransferase UbiE [Anaerolineae bacterium]|nr:Ubiquinone/menaquinone biosynthesis C-methyltransferase UbiE [Anaerolineae bacterium]
MNKIDKGQVTGNAAEVYEEFFVPALFQRWATPVANAAKIESGQRVLDVACGTGILARTVAERVRPGGAVVGLDVNEGMLAVAKRQAPHIEWRSGVAEDLPFDTGNFDAVVSQFGLMFFENRLAAIREMVRVLRPGGRLAVAVWDTLENTPGYAVMVNLLQRLFGEEVANGLRAPYILGNVPELQSLFRAAGIPNAAITTHPGTAQFPSITSWVYTDIKGWVLADMLDDAQIELLLNEAEQMLHPFVADQGAVTFSAPAHIITFVKP